ncbi:hypothetical protein [Methylobacterium thuringiense]|uniref:Uncharacterized protein n=1 Tax=Methylobacterium thuringiense TaxID=1003091 RepID=A0ABQ4TIC9_9HYPH|nr:hypothetical protein [Methylobacterium thuringiense]GJE53812.1 hypothetical protein EKPJFOCH_0280 [Methylobacterium thuringiense]
MADSSVDLEDLLVNVCDPDDPTPRQLLVIFQDIVARLNAQGLSYAVLGRIALANYAEPQYVSEIEIVAALHEIEPEHTATLVHQTRAQFAMHMDQRTRTNAISLSLRNCTGLVETKLLTEATTCTWLGITTRLASPEHLLWLWCLSHAPDHGADAVALIRGNAVNLQRVQSLLREVDDVEEIAQGRLRMAIGEAVLATEFSFSRYMEERRSCLKPD